MPKIVLCLSGGGYRATLYELGCLKRLNELGILSKVSTISSVSGGSLLAAAYASYLLNSPQKRNGIDMDFERFEQSVHELCFTDLRSKAFLARPWPGQGDSVKSMQKTIKKNNLILNVPLSSLEHDLPLFIFCATDLVYGVLWEASRQWVGSYKSGYIKKGPQLWTLPLAACVSACCPPMFDPYEVGLKHDDFTRVPQRAKDTQVGLSDARYNSKRHRELRESILINDGGLYDNLGLEPVWKSNAKIVDSSRCIKKDDYIFCLDGGKAFVEDDDASRFGLNRVLQYNSIISRQVQALRKRLFWEKIFANKYRGDCWSIKYSPTKYSANLGYSALLAERLLNEIRTDLDQFSIDERHVLIKHGYELTEAVMQKKHSHLIDKQNALPMHRYKGAITDEIEVREALRDSHKRVYIDAMSFRENRNRLVESIA